MPNKVQYTFSIKDMFTGPARRIRAATAGIDRGMKRVAVSARAAGTQLAATGRKLRAPALLGGVAAVASVKAFGNLQAGVENVLTLLDSPEEVASSRKEFRGLTEDAIKLGFSIDDTSTALFNNISALGNTERATKAFKEAQKLAIAGVAPLSTSVKGIAAIMNAYGAEITDSNEVANAFFTAQKKGTTTVRDLAANIGKVAPIAKAAGVGFKELLAMTAQLTQGGLSTEEATTALKATLTAIVKPAKGAEKVLRAMGVPVGITEIKAAGLTKTMLLLAKAAEIYPDEIAKAIPNVRAFTGVSALGRKELKRVQMIIELMNKDIREGSGLNEAYVAQQRVFNKEMARFGGRITVVAASMGEDLVPAVKGMINFFDDAVLTVNVLSDALFGLIHNAVGAGGAVDNFFNNAKNPFQVFGEGGLLDRRAKAASEAATGAANARTFPNRIAPQDINVAITASASPGSAINAVQTSSSGPANVGVNNAGA